jgi:hypothetical protein
MKTLLWCLFLAGLATTPVLGQTATERSLPQDPDSLRRHINRLELTLDERRRYVEILQMINVEQKALSRIYQDQQHLCEDANAVLKRQLANLEAENQFLREKVARLEGQPTPTPTR